MSWDAVLAVLPQLLCPALLTASLETVIFLLLGVRGGLTLFYWFFLNMASNLLVNFGASVLTALSMPLFPWAVPALEVLAVLGEYFLLIPLCGRSRRLFGMVLLSNLVAYGLGGLIFGFV